MVHIIEAISSIFLCSSYVNFNTSRIDRKDFKCLKANKGMESHTCESLLQPHSAWYMSSTSTLHNSHVSSVNMCRCLRLYLAGRAFWQALHRKLRTLGGTERPQIVFYSLLSLGLGLHCWLLVCSAIKNFELDFIV